MFSLLISTGAAAYAAPDRKLVSCINLQGGLIRFSLRGGHRSVKRDDVLELTGDGLI